MGAWTKLLVASNISKEMQMQNPQAVLDVLNYYEHSSKHKTDDKYMTQTPSTDPSPRPSYSVSTHALSSPSSQVIGAPSPSPPVSVAASSSIPSPVLPEAPTPAADLQAQAQLHLYSRPHQNKMIQKMTTNHLHHQLQVVQRKLNQFTQSQ